MGIAMVDKDPFCVCKEIIIEVNKMTAPYTQMKRPTMTTNVIENMYNIKVSSRNR